MPSTLMSFLLVLGQQIIIGGYESGIDAAWHLAV